MRIQHYQDLIAWQKAMLLVEKVYEISRSFPADERFGLTNQIRRAAVSVPSNIAEGQGRGRTADFSRFLRMANSSRQEVETQLLIAVRLGYITAETASSTMELAAEVGRIISGLARSIEPPTGN